MALSLVLMFFFGVFFSSSRKYNILYSSPSFVYMMVLIFHILLNCAHFNYKERVIVWISVILYATSFPALLGVAHNEFILILITGLVMLFVLLVTFFVQKRRFGKYF